MNYTNRVMYYSKKGGHVKPLKYHTKHDMLIDSVPCILQPNEVVIPLKYVKIVEPLLQQLGIYNTKTGKFL